MGLFKKFFNKEEKSETQVPAPPPPLPPEPEPLLINEIEPDELNELIQTGENVTIIDLRQNWEYESGHIPGAVSLPIMDLPRRRSEIPQDRPVVLQCYHGISSLDAAGYLIDNGWEIDKIRSLAGGMSGWTISQGIDSLVKDE